MISTVTSEHSLLYHITWVLGSLAHLNPILIIIVLSTFISLRSIWPCIFRGDGEREREWESATQTSLHPFALACVPFYVWLEKQSLLALKGLYFKDFEMRLFLINGVLIIGKKFQRCRFTGKEKRVLLLENIFLLSISTRNSLNNSPNGAAFLLAARQNHKWTGRRCAKRPQGGNYMPTPWCQISNLHSQGTIHSCCSTPRSWW